MKKLLVLLVIFIANNTFAQKVSDTIVSKKLNETRHISISLPASYKKTNQKYPLLIVLDGEFLVDPFQGALSYGNYWDDLPEMIVVGINQNKKNEREEDSKSDDATGLPIDKGADFFEFIGIELIPYIEKKYRVAPFRIIAGLDTTAGFLNYYLYKDNPVFDGYISLSPDLPLDMEKNIPDRLTAIPKPIFYYLSTAEGDIKKMRNRIQLMDGGIQKIKRPNLFYKYDDFKGASHYSLVLNSIPSALYHIFSAYQPISTTEFQQKIVKLPSGYVDYLVKKYELLDKTFNMKLQIRLSDFKAIEAAILKNKAYNEMEQLAQLARKNYPKTMLADYELGQMYEKKGDAKKAIKSYQSAYQQQEIGDLTKDMMLERVDNVRGGGDSAPAEETPQTAPSQDAPAQDVTPTPTTEEKKQ